MNRMMYSPLPGLLATLCLCASSLSGCELSKGSLEVHGDPPNVPSEEMGATKTPDMTPTSNPDSGGGEGRDMGTDMSPSGVATPWRGGVKRLTQAQYGFAVHDLFGDEVALPDVFTADPQAESSFTFSTVLSRQVLSDDAAVDLYARTASHVSAQLFVDEARSEARLGCAPSGPQDVCVADFMEGVMQRAWARPVAPEELERYLRVVAVGSEQAGLWEGLSMAVAAVLESPNFLYRAQLGEPDPTQDGAWRFTDYEMADRLALLLWSSVPDEALLQAAERGELTSEAGLRAQAERMLSDRRVERGIMLFLEEWFGLEALDVLSKDEETYPAFSHTLGGAMREEITYYFRTRVLEQDIDFLELLTSRQVRVNAELARLYGLSEPTDSDAWELREVPESWERGGLLTTPGILALSASRTRTSPTLRGLYVLERLLCLHIDPAPDNLQVQIEQDLAPREAETIREWNTRFRMNTQCATCHNVMDPIGLTLGRFDGLGMHQTMELGQAIDASGKVLGEEIEDAKALGRYLRSSPVVQKCVVRQLMRYANGQEEQGEVDEAAIDALTGEFTQSGNRIKALLLAFILSDAFRKTGPMAP